MLYKMYLILLISTFDRVETNLMANENPFKINNHKYSTLVENNRKNSLRLCYNE